MFPPQMPRLLVFTHRIQYFQCTSVFSHRIQYFQCTSVFSHRIQYFQCTSVFSHRIQYFQCTSVFHTQNTIFPVYLSVSYTEYNISSVPRYFQTEYNISSVPQCFIHRIQYFQCTSVFSHRIQYFQCTSVFSHRIQYFQCTSVFSHRTQYFQCTSVFSVVVEIENTLHKVLVEYGRVSGQEQVKQTELRQILQVLVSESEEEAKKHSSFRFNIVLLEVDNTRLNQSYNHMY